MSWWAWQAKITILKLDKLSDDVCPQFIAGSHRWGRWFVPQRFTGEQYARPQDGFETLPDIEAESDRYDIKHWALEPGDALDVPQYSVLWSAS